MRARTGGTVNPVSGPRGLEPGFACEGVIAGTFRVTTVREPAWCFGPPIGMKVVKPEWGSLQAASCFSRTPCGAEAPRRLKPAPRFRPRLAREWRACGLPRQSGAQFAIWILLAACASLASAATVRVGWREPGGRVSIQTLDLEDYTAAALNGEAGVFTNHAALEALAVTIRTYARANRGRHGNQGFDFCDTTHCQRLLRSAAPTRVTEAVERTKGEILWARGRAAEVYFHRNCGGKTEDAGAVWPGASRAWLPIHEDEACARTSTRAWRAEIALPDLARALGVHEIRALDVASRSHSGRIATLRMDSGLWDAERVHLGVGRALGWGYLKSRLYDVHIERGKAVFEGRGSGHGVGLCQDGAEARGLAGQSAEQILAFYFPGTRADVTARGFAWKELRGERVILRSESPEGPWLSASERALTAAEGLAGIAARPGIRVVVYPTLDAYRDATGEPGFVAGSTRGLTIHLQPAGSLRARGILEPTLLHEMLHALLAQRSRTPLPRWFGEGLVAALIGDSAGEVNWTPQTARMLDAPRNQQELREAYAACASRVRRLIRENGRAAVLGWVETGLPANVR
jgi:stage II sporulation protein D